MTNEKKTSAVGAALVVITLVTALFLILSSPSVPSAFTVGQQARPVMEATVIVTPLDTGTSDVNGDTAAQCLGDYETDGHFSGTNVQDESPISL